MAKRSLKSNAKWTITRLLKNAEGYSFESRHSMIERLRTFVNDLYSLGYRIELKSLKRKHIDAVVVRWLDQSLSPATIKNRMTAIRVLCSALGKENIVRSNNEYGIPNRSYTPQLNKAINRVDHSKITNAYIQHSLDLQRAYGLRREESLKIIPSLADRGDILRLKGSWTKGNVPRDIPIRTDLQREVLERAKALVERGKSLIPEGVSYRQHINVYKKQTKKAGLHQLHGLRHAYAQERYYELTGWKCPLQGGKPRKALTPQEKATDKHARLIIANELGHSRWTITRIYLN